MNRFSSALLLAAAIALTMDPASHASAQRIATCVEVRAADLPDADRRALTTLVKNEVDRHSTHISARSECASQLLVELISLEGHRYLTARMGLSVPDRVEVETTLEAAASELLTVVLHNDPVRLRRPDQDRGLNGALHRLRSEGHTLWEIELLETSGRLAHVFFSLPGLGLNYRRELAQFSLGARVTLATRTSRQPATLAPVALFGIAFDVRYHVSGDANTSAYIGGQLGLSHQWLHGPSLVAPNRSDSANSTGLALGLRLGVELFRTTTTRLDLFSLLDLPMFRSRDQVDEVVKTWLPTLSVGVGLGL